MDDTHRREDQQAIRGDMITLGQLVKLLNLVSSGAEVKAFLAAQRIVVNGELENRRGRKLYAGDLIAIPNRNPVRIC